MKKILLLLLLLLFIVPVYAKENRLYIVEDERAIKYESGLFDEKMFMKHTDMVPGSRYTDELTIENGMNKPYKLYLKANKRTNNADADKLLDNIIMKIYLDGKVIFEGKANGQGNVNLSDSIYLGEFAPNKSVKMKVETYLSVDYENPREDDTSYVDWTFYAQVDEETPKPVVPITGSNVSTYIIIGAITLLAIAFVMVKLYKETKKKAI